MNKNNNNNILKLNKKFNSLILKLEKINAKELDISEKSIKTIEEIGKIIKKEKLLSLCNNKYFAKQLMRKNKVPR